MEEAILLTNEQRFKLEKLWFIYGNNGPKSTMADHRFIQCLLELSEDDRKLFKPSREVIEKVDEILRKES